MKSLLFLLSLTLVLAQPPAQIELSSDIWDAEINPFLDSASRMTLGTTSKNFKQMTHRLNRLSEAELNLKRKTCDFAMTLKLAGSGYGMFRDADHFHLDIGASIDLMDQTTCLEGYVPKISQFDHVFNDLMIRLPCHNSTDDIKALGDSLLTMLERLFKHKKQFKTISIKLVYDNENLKLDLRTEERLFRMMKGTSVEELTLGFEVVSLERFKSFAVQSDISKLTLLYQGDLGVYDVIQEFVSLRNLNVNENMDPRQLYTILESLPRIEELSFEMGIIAQSNMLDSIKRLSIRNCVQALENMTFSGKTSLVIGNQCIQSASHELINILALNKETLTRFSIALTSTTVMGVILYQYYS